MPCTASQRVRCNSVRFHGESGTSRITRHKSHITHHAVSPACHVLPRRGAMRRELHVQRLVLRLKHSLPVNKMLDLQLQSQSRM